jgi:O-antigen ligase
MGSLNKDMSDTSPGYFSLSEDGQRRLQNLLRHAAVALLGALFAVFLYKVWSFEYRWFVVAIAGIAMVSIAFMLAPWFSDFLLLMLMLAIPLAGFVKWLFVGFVDAEQLGNVAYSGAMGLGLLDFLLAGLYMSWLGRIFVLREQPLPKLCMTDFWVALLICAYLLSIPGTSEPRLGFHAVANLLKYVLLYFYVSRNLQTRHVYWFLGAIVVAILMQAVLGGYQQQTGQLLGIALDKGAGGEALEYQYEVPGMENQHRATGTAYDSHSLGLMMGMLLPIPFVMIFARWLPQKMRIVAAGVALLAAATLILSYSRSAWVATAVGLCLLIAILFFRWRETQVIPGIALGILVTVLVAPWMLESVIDRFANAPFEVLTTRFEQWEVAIDIWMHYPFFGYGVGNYMESLQHFNFGMAAELPVHNVFLWILAESGIFGAFAFYGLILHASLKLWLLARDSGHLIGRMALAIVIAFFIYCLDGMTDPLFREPVVYTIFWFYIALSVVLPRLYAEQQGPDYGRA